MTIFRDSNNATNLRSVDARGKFSIEEGFPFAEAGVFDGGAQAEKFFPIAGVIFLGETRNVVQPCAQNMPYFTDTAFRTFGWWLYEQSGIIVPINLQYEIRGGTGSADAKTSEVLDAGTMVFNAPGQIGLISQVTGVLASRIEFWAHVNVADSTRPINLRVGLIADRFGGAIKQVQHGALVP